jgi:hypothetical protein
MSGTPMSKWRYVRGLYSDECGGVATVAFRDSPKACDHGKQAYDIKVIQNGKTVWAPSDPRRIPTTLFCAGHNRNTAAKIGEDALGFFEHYRCGRGTLSGLRGRRRRRRR